MDEENIVRQMIAGDMGAFEELMKKYEKPALRAAWLISGNAADSEDIVQETFTICYLNRKKLRNPAAFRTWFYRILTRTAPMNFQRILDKKCESAETYIDR